MLLQQKAFQRKCFYYQQLSNARLPSTEQEKKIGFGVEGGGGAILTCPSEAPIVELRTKSVGAKTSTRATASSLS